MSGAQRGFEHIRQRVLRKRASDSPILDVPWHEYLRVVEAVAELATTEHLGRDPADTEEVLLERVGEVLTRWGLNPQVWIIELKHLDRRCSRFLGAAQQMMDKARQIGQQWLQHINWCRQVFLNLPTDTFG